MKLWCYNVDHGRWAELLHAEALRQGVEAYLFTKPDDRMRKGDYVFMRIPQWQPELDHGKAVASHLHARGLILIPDYFTCVSYEDKEIQTIAYGDWMPQTYLLRRDWTVREAVTTADGLGYPFISKSREASSSVNVRLITSQEDAVREYELAMGEGIVTKIGKGRTGLQKDYLIWQKFCKNNPGDLRACINGRHLLLLERDNRPGAPFASGSGKNRPVNNPTEFQHGALAKAQEFFSFHGLKWNGIDLVFDYDTQEWKVLETTLGWSQSAYADCEYFGTQWRGEDIWKVLLHEIQEGVFG